MRDPIALNQGPVGPGRSSTNDYIVKPIAFSLGFESKTRNWNGSKFEIWNGTNETSSWHAVVPALLFLSPENCSMRNLENGAPTDVS